jgi:hypothetical protein
LFWVLIYSAIKGRQINIFPFAVLFVSIIFSLNNSVTSFISVSQSGRLMPVNRRLQEVLRQFVSSIQLQAIPWMPVQGYPEQPIYVHRSCF